MWDFVTTELINKLNFLEDEDQEASTAMSTNPFDEPDDDIHPNHFNPFGDPDEEGMFNSVSKNIFKLLIWWIVSKIMALFLLSLDESWDVSCLF